MSSAVFVSLSPFSIRPAAGISPFSCNKFACINQSYIDVHFDVSMVYFEVLHTRW
ncbi:hypothetical protein K413DRAFT_4929 [Clostridium sp. ASBs410]|nr:hypothetical protein K413DRAFT_4929 [Clostridium sp. ASBs410]